VNKPHVQGIHRIKSCALLKRQNSELTLSFCVDLGAAFLRAGEKRARMPRILLAEDDDVVRDMLQAVLERDGFEVVAVANVREALSRIAAENFDEL
jgi:PleD family two-component response regulator